jgi:hypothetical protein
MTPVVLDTDVVSFLLEKTTERNLTFHTCATDNG